MKLILGKGDNGTAEMQSYFSHIPGTIEFPEMAADLTVAQEELFKYLGEPLVQKAVDHYYSDVFMNDPVGGGESEGEPVEFAIPVKLPDGGFDDLSEDEQNYLYDVLVNLMQNAVTLLGYREYALNNDATHTKTGRMARMDKDTDEWTDKLIDHDDRALQRKGQKAITRLIKFVMKWQFPEFVENEPYNSTKDLLLWNSEKFHRFHPIDHDDRLFMLMLPMNRSIQQDYIEPLFEAARLAELVEYGRNGGALSAAPIAIGGGAQSAEGEAEKKLKDLYDKVGYVIAYMSLSKGYKELPVQLFPETMARNFWAAGNGTAFIAFRDKISEDTWKEGMRKLNVLMMHLEKLRAAETQVPITDDTIVNIDKRMREDNKYVRV